MSMIFGKAKILHSHGWQYIPDLNGVTLTEEFRGFPILSDSDDTQSLERAVKMCPTQALTAKPLTLDMGKKSAPEILCHILKTAPGNAAAAPKKFLDNAAAKPEFCIPVSMEIVTASL